MLRILSSLAVKRIHRSFKLSSVSNSLFHVEVFRRPSNHLNDINAFGRICGTIRPLSTKNDDDGNPMSGKFENEAENLEHVEAKISQEENTLKTHVAGADLEETPDVILESDEIVDERVIPGRMRKRRRKPASEASPESSTAGNLQQGNKRETENSIVPTGPRPENFPQVIAIPLTRRPLFPGFYIPVTLKKSTLLDKLIELKAKGTVYVGAFLVKDKSESGSSFAGAGEANALESLTAVGMDLFRNLHEHGTFAQVTQLIPSMDGETTQVLLMGHRRLRLTEMAEENPLTVSVEHLKDGVFDPHSDMIKAMVMELVSSMKELMRMNPLYKEHITLFVTHIGEFNAARMADFGAALTTADEPSLQAVLQELNVEKRLELTLMLVKKELELSKLQATIAKGMEEKLSGEQRKFMLMEQLKLIKKELGLEKDDKAVLIAKFKEKLEPFKAGCPSHVLQVIEEELSKLSGLEASSSEFNVTRNYLDWLTSIPWGHCSEENFDVVQAQRILDEDHYGLEDVKERLLEFIAVGSLKGSAQGKIICLSGPPGVGKTSIGRSMARALNRSFYRFSVGGLFDTAEIKGHRRTYVGAMPGKLVQCLKTTQTANPLVLIDEIDKLGRGHSGDPASSLLELLDPEQNGNFLDHYLDVPIDLSKVLFVCTANVVESIPGPLLDRMEVIRLAGYIAQEKRHIAREYLEPTALLNSGLSTEHASLTDPALDKLIQDYCREAGVRSLNKHIEKIYRKVALKLVRSRSEAKALSEGSSSSSSSEVAEDSSDSSAASSPPSTPAGSTADSSEFPLVIGAEELSQYVGQPLFQDDSLAELYGHSAGGELTSRSPVGVVTGLAWTAMGGCTLTVEATIVEKGPGKGSLGLTGQLGDVMKESASIAHILARATLAGMAPAQSSLAEEEEESFFSAARLHVHVPSGATPKDGPSAGCALVTAMLSLALGKGVRPLLAMTGEVTLTGRVLPIGGVKEKTVAARRSGVKTLIFPVGNKWDFEELPGHLKEGLDVHFVSSYDQVFRIAFGEDSIAE